MESPEKFEELFSSSDAVSSANTFLMYVWQKSRLSLTSHMMFGLFLICNIQHNTKNIIYREKKNRTYRKEGNNIKTHNGLHLQTPAAHLVYCVLYVCGAWLAIYQFPCILLLTISILLFQSHT